MEKYENVVLTNMCMVTRGDEVLVQLREGKHYGGLLFPGGHVEAGENFHDSVVREVFEETGITVIDPELCGVKQFHTNEGHRYIVFLYRADKFKGEVRSSDEGEAMWVKRDELFSGKYGIIPWFPIMLEVFESEKPRELFHKNGVNYIF